MLESTLVELDSLILRRTNILGLHYSPVAFPTVVSHIRAAFVLNYFTAQLGNGIIDATVLAPVWGFYSLSVTDDIYQQMYRFNYNLLVLPNWTENSTLPKEFIELFDAVYLARFRILGLTHLFPAGEFVNKTSQRLFSSNPSVNLPVNKAPHPSVGIFILTIATNPVQLKLGLTDSLVSRLDGMMSEVKRLFGSNVPCTSASDIQKGLKGNPGYEHVNNSRARGGRNGGPIGGKMGSKEDKSRAGKIGSKNQPREARVRGGKATGIQKRHGLDGSEVPGKCTGCGKLAPTKMGKQGWSEHGVTVRPIGGARRNDSCLGQGQKRHRFMPLIMSLTPMSNGI